MKLAFDQQSIQTNRNKTYVTARACHKEKDGLASLFLQGIDALRHVGRGADGFLPDLDDDFTGLNPFVGRRGIGVDAGHHDALYCVLDTEAAPEVIRDSG